MTKLVRQFVVIVCIIGFGLIAAYLILIYSVGRNYVHDKPASDEYYQNISNRIYFTTKYRGDEFDTLVSSFLKKNSQYALPDSINPQLIGDNSCDCNCLSLKKFIYFNSSPKEIYYIIYDHDTMYAAGAGVIDIVFSFKNGEWLCTKSSKFDSTEKERIEYRLDTTILEKL